jgi:hypothetical protein
LSFVVVGLLGNGLYVWHQLGPANYHTGRAIFFGLALLAALWAAVVYTFKLSVCVRVGPHAISVVRGPWRTELAWAQVTRLVERVQVVNGRRLRWVVVLAHDGRSLQVREDMVGNYGEFRIAVYGRYRMWRDHGGTWGTTGGGPFSARETASAQATWLAIFAVAALLPGLYFTFILTITGLLGPVLVVVAIGFGLLGIRAVLRRRAYTVDGKGIQSRQVGRRIRLAWRDVKHVDRTRHTFGGIVHLWIRMGRLVLRLAARTDSRVESFDWYPRVPEYLILRGAGRQVRIRLHRLANPDELLAWVEFYERAGRHVAEASQAQRTAPLAGRLTTGAPALGSAPATTPDLSGPTGPLDPWGSGREGLPQMPAGVSQQAATGSPTDAPTTAMAAREGMEFSTGDDSDAAWLRAETSGAWYPGIRSDAPTPSAPRQGTPAPAGQGQHPQGQPPGHYSGGTPAPSPDSGYNAHEGPTATSHPAGPQVSSPSSNKWYPPVQREPAPQAASWPPPTPRQRSAASGPIGEVEGQTPLEAAEGVPTDPSRPLADAFRLWGPKREPERPRLPRYGPPLTPEAANPDDAVHSEGNNTAQ